MTQPDVKEQGIATQAQFAFDGSIRVDQYDLMFLDTNDVKPASSQADAGSEAANQAAFAPRFAGVALDARSANDTQAVPHFPVATDIEGVWDCVSATFEVGDMVTVDEDSGGTFLEDQKLVKTTDKTLAIGKVVRRYGSATTRVRVRLQSRVLPHGLSPYDSAVPAGAGQAALTNSTGGTGDGTLSAVGDTMAANQAAVINNNFTELHTLVDALRSALVTHGLIKGSA